MQTRIITEDIAITNDIRFLTQAYQEISVIKMKRVRDAVLKTRDFLSGVLDIFTQVKVSYKSEIDKLIQQGRLKSDASQNLMQTNGKTLCILLSANTNLYGTITQRIFDEFITFVQSQPCDVAIVGKIGKILYETHMNVDTHSSKQYTYFELPDEHVETNDLKPLLTFLFPYEHIHVFHGKFTNVLTQTPTMSTISGSLTDSKQTSKEKFFFEPTLTQILNFFQTQILTALCKQTVHESQLARFASRISAMEETMQHIDDELLALTMKKHILARQLANKKQLGRLASLSLWNLF